MVVLGVLVPLWAGSLGEVICDPEVCVSLQQVNRTAPSEAAPLSGWESVLIGIGRATVDRDAFWHAASLTPSTLQVLEEGFASAEGTKRRGLEGSSAR